VAEITDPVAANGQAVIAVKAASVNPSDVRNVAGAFPATVLPRVPWRDFAGVVVDGPPDWISVEVWGTGGDVEFTRDGSHAELLGVPVVYNAVGSVTTAAALAALAPGGRLVAISAVGTHVVEIDLVDFYRNESRLLGADSSKLGVIESGTILAELAPHSESGAFRPLPISGSYRLEESRDAYLAVADGTAGRVVIRP
jgi:NADPH:quinone reductase-like Zn-dependent oxidoreductase